MAVRGASALDGAQHQTWVDASFEVRRNFNLGQVPLTGLVFLDGALVRAEGQDPALVTSTGSGLIFGPIKMEFVRHRNENKMLFGLEGLG